VARSEGAAVPSAARSRTVAAGVAPFRGAHFWLDARSKRHRRSRPDRKLPAGCGSARECPVRLSIVPQPRSVRTLGGVTHLGPTTTLDAGPGTEEAARLLRLWIGQPTGLALPPSEAAARWGENTDDLPDLIRVVRLRRRPPAGETHTDEAYHLRVEPGAILVEAASHRGLVWALQVLRQLLPVEVCTPGCFGAGPLGPVSGGPVSGGPVSGGRPTWPLATVDVVDAPRFRWRGGHLDVARHFFPLEVLFREVDLLSLHRFNVFHLHLTDDQGWRMEIERAPRLTEIGAWRRGTEPDKPNVPHGGYYTQAELRRLVTYAQARGVEVVPEIEMPGHAQAAIAAYPELGTDPSHHFQVATGWGVLDGVFNVEEETIHFLEGVLEEVLEVFPSRFIHIGGDECPKEPWRRSPAAQARRQDLGLADEDQLQSYIVGRIGDFLARRSRLLVGWDEILEGGLPRGATVMSWRGEEGGVAAARAGHDVVMCPEAWTYFDWPQEPTGETTTARRRVTTWSQVYDYEPVPAEIHESDAAGHVLGTQFQVWTERIDNVARLDEMTFPRAAALAEVAWGRPLGADDRLGFGRRLATHARRLSALGVHVHSSANEPSSAKEALPGASC